MSDTIVTILVVVIGLAVLWMALKFIAWGYALCKRLLERDNSVS